MKQFFIFLIFISTGYHALATGQDRGGGDLCENQFKIIRDDISNWIHNNGHVHLELPQDISTARYAGAMQTAIRKLKIKCVGEGNVGYPVVVYGTPKICAFELKTSTITCDRKIFLGLEESEQYRLVHHEIAGLAGIENPNGADSNYTISNQISQFLEFRTVKRLAIKKNPLSVLPLGILIHDTTRYPNSVLNLGGKGIRVSQQTYGVALSGQIVYGNNYLNWYTVVKDVTTDEANNVTINTKGKLQVVYGSRSGGGILCEYDVQVQIRKFENSYYMTYQFPISLPQSTASNFQCPFVNTDTLWRADNYYSYQK